MAPPQFDGDAAALPDPDYPTFALSLIKLRGYREPGPDLLDEIVCDALAAAEAEDDPFAAPIASVAIRHIDRLVRVAAADERLQSV